jgi:murein DD-endopeptidase MepM/ murein hydrolase activator NlpD
MYPVSSPYGPRDSGFHTGTDFAVPGGVPILASNDGQVIYTAYEAGGAGNTVTISGSDGWQSRYHHLQSWIVAWGQNVLSGQVIGYCDSTGASTGNHLHFEIRPTPTTTTDPIPYLEEDAGHIPTPDPDPTPDDETLLTEDDVMLIFNQDRGAAIICGNHRPRKIASVNSWHGPFVVLEVDAWDQYWQESMDLYSAAVK